MHASDLTKLKGQINSRLTQAIEFTEANDHVHAYAQVKKAQLVFHAFDIQTWLNTIPKKEKQYG